ncbi:MAG: LacI family DNA-binding transcriptional regulator [Chloroflexota bacterium]|nr:LacI family DNA-binding transcriptional regulator [Chloroflexota bacterium]
MGKRVTIKDVARETGVSRQTVSRVINAQPGVAEDTRARVAAAIKQLGYQPNPAARSLTQHRTNTIGLIIPYSPDYLFSDPHLMEFMCGVDELAIQRNHNLLLSTAQKKNPAGKLSAQKESFSAFERLALSGYADGVVVVETLASRAGTVLLRERGISWVTLGYGTENESSQVVHADDRGGARQATMHLLSLGHTRIGVISGRKQSLMAVEERLTGYRQALSDLNLTMDAELLVAGDWSPESGTQAAAHLMQLDVPPTAIFAFNDRMACGALQYLQANGWRVPQDISLVGFDDIPIAQMLHPQLTTVKQPALEMGRQAARLLFDLIENNTLLSTPVILPTELIVRGSTGKCRGS